MERGEWIGDYKEDSDVAKTWTWAEIKSKIPDYIDKIPEDKIEDYWWYGLPNSFYVNKDSYVHELNSDSAELSLESYDIYLALKDKPKFETENLPDNGTFVTTKSSGHTLKMNGSSFNYDSTEYTCIQVKLWLSGSTYNGYAVLLTDGSSNYAAYLMHYYNPNSGEPYCNLRPPKSYEGDVLPDDINWDIMPPAKNLVSNFKKQQ